MPTKSAVRPVLGAANAVLQAMPLAGDKVYHEGDVPLAPPKPYVVAGTWAEPALTERHLSQRGREQAGQLRFWGVDFEQAMTMYEDAVGRLDRVLLDLTAKGFRMTSATLSYLTDGPDPRPEVRAHVVVSEYRTRTVTL